jgi:hypothetical protein
VYKLNDIINSSKYDNEKGYRDMKFELENKSNEIERLENELSRFNE